MVLLAYTVLGGLYLVVVPLALYAWMNQRWHRMGKLERLGIYGHRSPDAPACPCDANAGSSTRTGRGEPQRDTGRPERCRPTEPTTCPVGFEKAGTKGPRPEDIWGKSKMSGRGHGGIGRRTRLKIAWAERPVGVQVPLPPPPELKTAATQPAWCGNLPWACRPSVLPRSKNLHRDRSPGGRWASPSPPCWGTA